MVTKKTLHESKDALGISGFTLGIAGIVMAGFAGLIFSILGFVFCSIQQKKHPTKIGKTGIIINVVAFVLSVILIILTIAFSQQLQNLV